MACLHFGYDTDQAGSKHGTDLVQPMIVFRIKVKNTPLLFFCLTTFKCCRDKLIGTKQSCRNPKS